RESSRERRLISDGPWASRSRSLVSSFRNGYSSAAATALPNCSELGRRFAMQSTSTEQVASKIVGLAKKTQCAPFRTDSAGASKSKMLIVGLSAFWDGGGGSSALRIRTGSHEASASEASSIRIPQSRRMGKRSRRLRGTPKG